MKERVIFNKEKKVAFLKDFPAIHGFSTIKAGNMSYRWGSREIVNQNLNNLYQMLTLDVTKEVHIMPEFGPTVMIVTEANQGETLRCDGLLTTVDNIPLGLCPADCLPIVLTTDDLQFVGLAHGGKENLIEYKIVERTIKKIQESLNIPSREILVGIGPGIGRCHYEYDLYLLAVDQLRRTKIPEDNIWIAGICTYCSKFPGEDSYIFFSHRRSQTTGEKEGRFAAIVALNPKKH